MKRVTMMAIILSMAMILSACDANPFSSAYPQNSNTETENLPDPPLKQVIVPNQNSTAIDARERAETNAQPVDETATVNEATSNPAALPPLQNAAVESADAIIENPAMPTQAQYSAQVPTAHGIPSETVSAKTDPATTELEVQATPLDLQEAMLSGTNYAASVYGTTADGSLDFTNSDYRFPGSLPGTCTQVELVRKVMDGVDYTFGQIMKQDGVTIEDIAALRLRCNVLCTEENGGITIYVFYAE